ncbi:MAG: hypothetical protein KBD51_00465 [Candidatus Levybacteria bacterium]|nr:hypothetical protein [Candidatus Levybacteria bacterium]
MTQEVFTGQIELTVRGINPTLNKEGIIFMSDAGINTEGVRAPQAPTPKVLIGSPPSPSPVDLRGEWMSAFSPRELQNIDTRRTIDAAVELGFGPAKVTSKGRTEQTAKSVVENAGLDSQDPVVLGRSRELSNKEKLTDEESTELFTANADRISKAQELLRESLGRELTDAEKKAILKAHFVGLGEKGKDEKNESGVFNVSEAQLLEKAKILKDAGFDKEQRREIIESGLAAPGDPGTPEYYEADIGRLVKGLERLGTTRGGAGFSDVQLEASRKALVDLYSKGGGTHGRLTREWLDKFADEVYDYVVKTPASAREGDVLQKVILGISRNFDLMSGRGRKELEFASKFDDLSRDPANHDFLVQHVREYVSTLNPSGGGIEDSVLIRVIKSNDRQALEHLVFRIVGIPLQSETGDYSIGFYGGINLDAITNLLQTMSQNPLMEPTEAGRALRRDQLKNISNIKEAVKITHEINALVNTHALDSASQIAPKLLPEYLQKLSRIKGVGPMMRLLESGHLELLSRNGYIDTEGYKEMMGNKQSKVTGNFETDQSKSIYEGLREFIKTLNDPAFGGNLRINGLKDFKGMEDWEIDLAFNLARDLYNNQHRSAEIASLGKVPGGMKAYMSAPFEGFLKIFNPGEWVLGRFSPGGDRGGVRWFDRLMDAMQRRRSQEGFGKMMLAKIKGQEIRKYELPYLSGIRGYWSSWKADGGLLSEMPSMYEPRGAVAGYDVYYEGKKIFDAASPGIVNIGYLLDTGNITFRRGAEEIKYSKKDEKGSHEYDEMRADFFSSIFFKPGTGGHGHAAELRDDLQMSLGTIYKIALGPHGGHGLEHNEHLNPVKEQIRALIWQRAAKDNPLAVLPYLHGLKYSDSISKGHKNPAKDPRLELSPSGKYVGRTVLEHIYESPGWFELHRKLTIWNEIKLAHNRGEKDASGGWTTLPDLDFSLDDAIRFAAARSNGTLKITPLEKVMLDEIEFEGVLASRDLANVRHAFIPFSNDVIHEEANYEKPGPESFGRHFRDIAQINGSTGALGEAMDNLGKISDFHKMVEFIDKFAKGITGVHGDAYAKDKAVVVTEATLAFFRRGENVIDKEEDFIGEADLPFKKRLSRWFKQQDEIHEITQKLHKPNSEAQLFFNNVHMLALDRGQMYEAMEELLAAGLMGHEEENEFKKRFGGTNRFFGFIARMILEGFMRGTKGALIVGGSELTKRSFKGAVQ